MSFWKKLAKIAAVAAPIAAAPFTGGASLALIGAGAGAASSALNGGGVKGALLGAGLGAATGGFGGGGGAAASGGASMAKSGMMSTIGKTLLKNAPEIAGAAGSALAAGGQASATNRGVNMDAALAAAQQNEVQRGNSNNANAEHDRQVAERQKQMQDQLMAREVEGRTSGNNAYTNVLRSDYAMNKKDYAPGSVTIMGKQVQVPQLIQGPRALSAGAKEGISAFQGENMARLKGGNQAPMPGQMAPLSDVQTAEKFQFDPKLLKQGMFEKIANIAGPGMAAYGQMSQQGAGTEPRFHTMTAGASTPAGAPMLSQADLALARMRNPQLLDNNADAE